MIITYFRLKGYINILQGMGLDELIIPFSNFHNRIILIQGENGTGKSTIIKALSPNPDSSDSFRTDVIIDSFGNRNIIEYPAEKEIHYLDTITGDVYRILIQSLVDESRTKRLTSKAYISVNGIEKNPNGNISSFKEMRDELLGINSIYLDMSSISSENRGLVDMIPSDRRRYLSLYIGSLDVYNNINKVLSRKSGECKSIINTLNNKIYEIGNEDELRIHQIHLEERLESEKKARDSLLKDLASKEATIQLLDPENKISDLCTSISGRLESINNEIKKNQDILVSLHTKFNSDDILDNFEEKLKEIENQIKEYEKLKSENQSTVSILISQIDMVEPLIQSDEARLLEISSGSLKSNIEKAVKDLQDEADIMKKYIDGKIDIYSSISLSELESLKSDIDNFKSIISVAKDMFSEKEFIESVEYLFSGKACFMLYTEIDTIKTYISTTEKDISDLEIKINKANDDLDKIKSFNEKRPKNCIDNSCPFISDLIQLSESYKDFDMECLNNEYKKLSSTLNSLKESLLSKQHVLAISLNLEQGLNIIKSRNNILSKIKELEFLNNSDEFKNKLINHNNFYEFSIIDDLLEFHSIYEEYKKIIDQLKDLETDYAIYKNNKKLIDSLNKSIEKNKKENQTRSDTLVKLGSEINFYESVLQNLNDKKSIIESIIKCNETLNQLSIDKEELRKEFNTVRDNIKLVKEASDSIDTIKSFIMSKDNIIKPLEEEISKSKYNLTNLIGYRSELALYNDAYEKYIFVRNACSPGNGNGIQSAYIKRYINDIIINCNQILGMFNESIQIGIPIINEKQFSIPFIGPGGIMVPDIMNGSTAQKCMIGLAFSCACMMRASNKYNIPRFDEIDGGLDHENRIKFIGAVNQALNIMGSQQCVMCSHNMEFDTQSVSKIICTHTGIRFE